MPREDLIQIRRGTATQWNAADAASGGDPTRLLASGELGKDTTTGALKIGDGTSLFADLKGYLDEIALSNTFVSTVSPLAYGAVGDDTADDTVPVQAAITAAAAFGLHVDLRGKTYKTTDTITVPTGATLTNGSIRCTGVGKRILNVTGDRVHLRDFSVIGRNATPTAADNEEGIHIEGASAAAPLLGIILERVSVELVGFYGIYLKFVTGLRIKTADLGDIGYAGIMGVSVRHFTVDDVRVENIVKGSYDAAYGISFTRIQHDSLVTSPRSEHGVVSNCYVDGVPWNAYDTHAGRDVKFLGNTALNCKTALHMGSSLNGSGVSTFAPHDCHALGNDFDSGVTDGSALPGIYCVGAGGTLGASVEHATGMVVAGNTLRGFGTKTNGASGSIILNDVAGPVVEGNSIIQPSPHGITLLNDCYGVAVHGNTVTDQWSDTITNAAVVNIPNGYVTGSISGNAHRNEGAKAAAAYKNEVGILNGFDDGISIELAANSLETCTLPLSGGNNLRTTSYAAHYFKRSALFPNGNNTTPGFAFANDTDTGFYLIAAGDMGLTVNGVQQIDYGDGYAIHRNGFNLVFGTGTGSYIGTGATQKMGFWGKAPIVQPSRAGQLTDSSGGTSGGATIAAVTDIATAANAIATIAAKYNALEAKLSAAGGGAGLTA